MSYIQDSLLKDEQVLFYSRPHFIIFYTVLIWLALAIFMWKITSNGLVAGVIVLVGMFSLIGDFINYYCSEYVITNKRIIMKVGFIRRKSLELFLDRVEGVYIDQTILGRILNFGTVTIAGVGGTKNPFFYIPKPLEFRSSVQKQLENRLAK